MLEGFSGRLMESRPRRADRTAITIAGAESAAATTPDAVIGHAAVIDGIEQPVRRERHENGGGVDVCEGVFEDVGEAVFVDEAVMEGVAESDDKENNEASDDGAVVIANPCVWIGDDIVEMD